MTTDISPLFGLRLLELAEQIADASIVIAIVILVSIAVNVWLSIRSNSQTERHARQIASHADRTAKIASANIALDLKKRFREEDFRFVLDGTARKS